MPDLSNRREGTEPASRDGASPSPTFPGGGELGALIRAKDWSRTSLGPIERWSPSLRTAVSVALYSEFPMILLWGPDLVQIYNDSYTLLMGGKHPAGLGQPTHECWPEAWHINEAIYPRVFAGETLSFREAKYPLAPHGVVQDYYLTLSYSPVLDDTGAVGGVFVTVFDVTSEVRTREERDRALTEVRGQRERLYEIFRQAPAAIAVLEGPSSVFTVANPRYRALVGDRDVIGKPLVEALPEVVAQGFVQLIDNVRTTGEAFIANDAVVRLDRRGDGALEDVYVDFVYQPMVDGSGETFGVMAHAVETTGHVLARRQLEQLAVEREAMLSQIADAVVTLHPDGRISFVNAAAHAIYPELEAGKTFREQGQLEILRLDGTRFEPDEVPTARARRGERVMDDEWIVRQPDGRELRVQGSAVPVTGPAGESLGVVLTVRDVTEARRLEQAAELERSRLVEVFQQAPAVIAVTHGPTHVLTTANPLFQQVVGASRSLNGRPIREAIPELEGQGFFELLDQVYATGEPFVGDELLARVDHAGTGEMRDGYFNFVYQPLRTTRGAVEGIMIHAVEVTDQVLARKDVERKAEELVRLAHALEQSNAELDQFAYVASHDLKAPLRGIANLTQWIEEDLADALTEESAGHMRLLQGRVQRMEALIDGILAYSRAGRVRAEPELVHTGALVRDVVELLALEPAAQVEVQDDMPEFPAERVPLQQVFLNLISNAVKYTRVTRPDVRVSVGWDAARDGYVFRVSDNGPGIAPEFHERIWGIFQTLEARDKVEGTGIGLSVVKKMVESRGGRTWLESTPGAGATFFFSWPRAAQPLT
jgi:PAS domain S-box-containing protein